MLDQEVADTNSTQYISAFTVYLEQKQAQLRFENSKLSYLEIIALT
jgi:hypothetical protein